MLIFCAHCGASDDKPTGAVNRAKRAGLAMYCNLVCAGLARRKGKTAAEKKEAKRLYDMQYRERNRDRLKAEKAAYFQRTYDPAKAAVERKKRAAEHAEYCRRPEYVAWKRRYDRKYRAKKEFGEFWESKLLLLDLDDEITTRASRYDVYMENGTINKTLRRKRDYEKAHREEPEGRPLGNLE